MKNPFVIFQIPAVFDIDLIELTKQYRILVTHHHPDKGGDAITMEDVNAAYNMLRNPIKRARVLVELYGVKITDEATLTDPTILEEIFELRMNHDEKIVHQKQQEALTLFKDALTSGDAVIMEQAYWRLLYLETLSYSGS